MVVIVLFFSSAVASAWDKQHLPMHKCLEAPGLGTRDTNFTKLKVDGGDSTVLLECRCECLEANHDTPMHKRLEAHGLGTFHTDGMASKVDDGDSIVLLKCRCQCLGQTALANARMSGSTGPWHPPHRFHCAQGSWW